MKKRLLLLLFAALPILPVFAAADFTVDGINYSTTGNQTCKVVSSIWGYSGDIVIPESVTYGDKTYTVESIGREAFYRCGDLTSVSIPNSVRSIGSEAFSDCNNLTSVIIGNSVSSIGNDAFYYCNGLIKCAYPNTLKNPFSKGTCIAYNPAGAIIEDGWIYGPEKESILFAPLSLEGEYIIPNSVETIGNYAFYHCWSLTSVIIGNSVETIGNYAFYNCRGLTSVTIPNSVVTIGSDAFYVCSGLTKAEFSSIEHLCSIEFGNYASNPLCYAHHLYIDGKEVTDVVIPESVETIGDRAFEGCSGLTSVTIGNSVETIGEFAFQDCKKLTSVIIPNSVSSIGNYAFDGCDGLKKSAYPNTLKNPFSKGICIAYNPEGTIIEDGLIYGPEKKEIFFASLSLKGEYIIPNSVETIGDRAFSGCSGLTSVTIGNSVETIGSSAFSGCSGLTSVIIGNSAETIGSSAFSGCSGLTSVIIGNSAETIGSDAFSGCTSLTSVDIPNSVKTIGSSAFYNCTGLTSVIIGNSVETIGSDAFRGCSGLTKAEFSSIEYLCSIKFVDYRSNPLAYAHNLYINGQEVNELVIPESVTAIGEYAFSGCSGLTSVIIPNSVTSIGVNAFSGCSGLASVIIGNSVETIGSYAFSDCSGLKKCAYPNTISNPFSNKGICIAYNPEGTIIEDGLIYGPEKKEIRFAPYTLEGEYTIPESVESIGSYAFSDCSGLTSVTIPNSVTKIGSGAFSRCSGLTSVIIGNSVETIDSNSFDGCKGLIKSAYPNTIRDPFSYGTHIAYNPQGAIIEDGWIYGPEKKEIRFAPWNLEGEYTIPESVESIGPNAFRGCSGLTSIEVTALVPPTFSENSFSGLYDSVIATVPYEAADLYLGSLWTMFKNLRLSGSETNITSASDGTLNYYLVPAVGADDKDHAIVKPGNYSGEITIPERFTYTDDEGNNTRYYVSGIGNQAFKNSWITKVNYNSKIDLKSIGEEAFSGCTRLYGIEIPNTVETIGKSAFQDCKNLTSVIIGNSVKSIGSSAFYNCVSLTSVDIPSSVATICDKAFSGCSRLTSVIIPNSVETIGESAFSDCIGLNSITIGNSAETIGKSVATIGKSAFQDCKNLTSAIIGNSVETIGKEAFRGCSRLTSVIIPNSVKTIGESVFYGCSDLTKAEFSNIEHLCSIEFGDYEANPLYYAHHLYINGEEVKDVVIPESVTSIGKYAFYGCSGLTSVSIPNSVTSIGKDAFQDCDKLTKAEFSSIEHLCSIEFGNYLSNPLYYANNLYIDGEEVTDVVIPESVESIGSYAFYGCSGLTSINIGNSVEAIGEKAFSGCTGLKALTFSESNNPIEIGDDAIPSSMQSLYWGRAIEDLNFSVQNLSRLTIGNFTTLIPANSFKGLTKLTTLKLGSSITEIEANAFSGCNGLNEVVLPPLVETIGESAFAGIGSVSSIIMGANVKSIGDKAFDRCSAKNVYITAQTPPEATNTTFSTYTAKLWLQDKGDNSVLDAYYDAFTCWDRFESSAMIAATEIKVDNNIDVVVGKPAEIKATVLPEDAALPQLFWRSSNPEVATVDCNGVVTAISETGECKIIAETLYANGPVAEINVTVKEAEAPKNPAISIEPATVELTVGKTAELTVTKTDIDDDEVVVWTSSDENVATVDAEGNVTAVGAGTATITATCAGVKAEATVIVNDDKSGINDVIAVDEKVTVYNLRGVKVGESTEGLPKGIYIVREGGKSRKVAL